MAINKRGAFVFFGLMLGLIACGDDDSSSSSASYNMDVVSEVSELPKCTKSNEGEMAWVKGETSARVCIDEKWYSTVDSDSSATFSCITKELKDNSGVKIICNGDSVGVVYNGKDGTDGKDEKNGTNGKDGSSGKNGTDGVGCSIAKIDEQKVRVICGKDSTVLYVGSASGETAQNPVVVDSEKIAISLDEITGVTQKGPFLMGSKVLVHEMEDGRTLSQTGNSFSGKIVNDKGEFKINARMLVSQYVMLEATGYYRNEVTGQNSSSELTLFAITDVNNRNTVNVNLLTHLEHDRVIYLVTQKNMKVNTAKKKAQKEIFGLFGIDATEFSNSEDLNIAGASDEDGALLAFSMMFQGDRTTAELTELLQKISNDMKEDGIWDDATTRMKIAEWSADADSSGQLTKIRNNVTGWNLSSKLPNFEKFVRKFWYEEYGLDGCKTNGVVKAATAGKRKSTKTRYICKDADGHGNMRWFVATDFEKDTYSWNDTTDGALRNGSVTGTKYVFDKTGSLNGSKGWRLAVGVENMYGGCVDSLYSKIRSYRGSLNAGYYQCQKTTHTWVLVNNNLMIDTQGWKNGDDGFSRWGDSIGVVSETSGGRVCYVYDTSAAYNGWRTGNNNDCTLGLFGCTAGRAGLMQLAENGNFYNCANNIWTQVTERVAPNTKGWSCLDSNDGEMKLGLYNTDVFFVCDANAWREAKTEEELDCRNKNLCNACTDKRHGVFWEYKKDVLVCDTREWRKPNCAEIATGSLCTANDSAVVWACEDVINLYPDESVTDFKVDYVCSNEKWHPVSNPYEYTLKDWKKKKEEYYTAKVHPDVVYGEDLVDDRDRNVYKTVVINGVHVMAENLRYRDSVENVNLKGNMWCYSSSNSQYSTFETKNCEIGGVYYTWTAAMNIDQKWQNADASTLITSPHRGICPKGWHIPDTMECKKIFPNTNWNGSATSSYPPVDGQFVGFSLWYNATDTRGFSMLPIGTFDRFNISSLSASFYGVNRTPDVFWSTTLNSSHSTVYYWPAVYLGVHFDGSSARNNGLSVRCVKDEE